MSRFRRSLRQDALRARAGIIREIREFFYEGGFLEAETPLRIPAPAPEAHIDAAPSGDWFLQTSPELCMKRLLAAGYPRIFQISRCWRDGERGRFHLPEFTMLEWYRARADYRQLMADCRGIITRAAAGAGRKAISFRGMTVELDEEWETVTVREAYRRHVGMTPEEALERGIFDQVMAEEIEPRLGTGTPTFLVDYPAARGALARLKPEDPSVAERFELYVAGVELANGFSELDDPDEQRRRFLAENLERRAAGRTVYPVPEPFLEDLAAMPPAAGIALGIDRLVMVLLDAAAIDDVVAFTPEEL